METSSFFLYSKDSISIDTNLSHEDFSKARLTQYLTSSGYVVRTANNNFEIDSWQFTETTLTAKNTIEVVGPGFEGFTLYEYFIDNSISIKEKYEIVLLLEKIYETAFDKNINIANLGPFFVLLNDKKEFLFLPKEYIERCLAKETDEIYSKYYGYWVNNTLSEKEGCTFTLAVYAYFVLTGRLPYSQENTAKRQEDYYDGNVVPLEYTEVSLLDTQAQKITNNLRLQRIKNKKSLQPVTLPSFEELQWSNSSKKENLNNKKLEKYSKTIKKNRFIRKYGITCLVSFAICLVALYIGISSYKTEMNKPTTKGLTDIEVVNMFYTAYNTLNVPLANATIQGNNLQDFITILSGYFINSQMRSSYEPDAGTLPINQWFYVKEATNYWPFGITHLTLLDENNNVIDGNLSFNYPVKKDKNSAIAEKKGSKKTIFADYYLIKSEGAKRLIVQKMHDEFTLKFNDNKWNIVDYISKLERIPLNNKEFFADYEILLKEGNTIPTIVENLQKKYVWLPPKDSVENGKIELADRFFYFAQ